MSEAAIAALSEAGHQPATVEVWPQNWPMVRAFAEVMTQWRVVPVGTAGIIYVGLDYAGARAALALARIRPTPELWDGVRVMEREAMAVLNRREG